MFDIFQAKTGTFSTVSTLSGMLVGHLMNFSVVLMPLKLLLHP